MRSNRPALALSLAALLAAASLADLAGAATQWKWRDAEGRVQYSDRPPPSGVSDKDILARPAGAARAAKAAAVASAASATASAGVPAAPALKASDPELEARRRKAEAEKQAAKQAEDARANQQRAENCERARGYQRALNDGLRISRTNAQGEREILDDKQRAQEQAKVNEAVSANCQ